MKVNHPNVDQIARSVEAQLRGKGFRVEIKELLASPWVSEEEWLWGGGV